MEREKVVKLLEAIPNGSIGTIEYVTNQEVYARYRKAGISIVCYTKKFVRFGASYKNILKKLSMSPSESFMERENNFTWVIKNKMNYNSNKDQEYVRFSRVNKPRISRRYVVTLEDGSTVELKSLMGTEYEGWLTSHGSRMGFTTPVVQNVKIENVLAINGRR